MTSVINLPSVTSKSHITGLVAMNKPFPESRVEKHKGAVHSSDQKISENLQSLLTITESSGMSDIPRGDTVNQLIDGQRIQRRQTDTEQWGGSLERSRSGEAHVHLELIYLGQVDWQDTVPGTLQHQRPPLYQVEHQLSVQYAAGTLRRYVSRQLVVLTSSTDISVTSAAGSRRRTSGCSLFHVCLDCCSSRNAVGGV